MESEISQKQEIRGRKSFSKWAYWYVSDQEKHFSNDEVRSFSGISTVDYNAFAETFSNSRKNHPWPEVDFFIGEMQKHGVKSILDIGCGNGRFLEQAELQWYQIDSYLGIDSSSGMITEARKLHEEYRFAICSMLDLSSNPTIPPSHYDALLFLASFHHLETREDRLTVLRDIKKYLAPGGRIYMTNWNLLEQERYKKSHRWDGDFDIKIGEYSRHYHGFSVEELAELFWETGYIVEKNEVWKGGRNVVSVVKIDPNGWKL